MAAEKLGLVKVLYRSPRIDTYVDTIAAVAREYPNIGEVRIVFPVGGRVAHVVGQVQARLVALAKNEPYEVASRLRLTDAEESITSLRLYRDCILVDVTGIPKQDALEVACAAIEKGSGRVGHFRWLETFSEGVEFRVGTHKYEYKNLLTSGATGALLRNYVARKHVVWSLGGLLGCVLVMAIVKIIWPDFIVPDDAINVFSLLIGAAGLYLAAASLRAQYPRD